MVTGWLLGKLAAPHLPSCPPHPRSFLLLMKTQGVQGCVGGAGSMQTLRRMFQMSGSLCAMWEVTVLNPPQEYQVSLTHRHIC